MKTITFYSYKGGVGRSLTLSEIAIRLSQLGQQVCVMDFDLEAPGLGFKFKKYHFPLAIKEGLVDYIFKFSNEGKVDKIQNYVTILKSPNRYFKDIQFISAGDYDKGEYWQRLSRIRWYDLFYNEDPQGIGFFLDLKAQIKKALNPDFLLIDSRTGVTDISGITLRLLADQVVVLGANNSENLFGCKKIIRSLLNTENNLFQKAPKVNFVLSRLSVYKYDEEKKREVIDVERESITVDQIKRDFREYLNLPEFDVSIIHADRSLENEESKLHDLSYEKQPGSVKRDYSQLFEKITDGYLLLDEKFLNSKKAAIEYIKSIDEPILREKLILIEKSIALDNTKFEYYSHRGYIYVLMGRFKNAIEDLEKSLKLAPENAQTLVNIALVYIELKEYDKASSYLEMPGNFNLESLGIKATIYRKMNRLNDALKVINQGLLLVPSDARLLNAKADVLRILGQHQEAKKNVSQAILIEPNQPLYFATLAEIYSSMNEDEEFFFNLGIALSKGLTVSPLNSAYDVYAKYLDNQKFINLINKYSIDVLDFQDERLYDEYKGDSL